MLNQNKNKMKTLSATLFSFIFAFIFMACENNYDDNQYAFDDWDEDADELVDRNEFGQTFAESDYYDDWDANSDGEIDEAEWQSGIDNNFSNYDRDTYGDFNEWDTNRDRIIDEDELIVGNFTVWDTDRDGNIELAEYEAWSTTGADNSTTAMDEDTDENF